MVKLSETGNDADGKIHHFHQPGMVGSGAVPVNRQTVSHARHHQDLYDCHHDVLREVVPQVAETDQEADTHTHHVTDVGVPCKMAVEQNAEVFDTLALLNGPATDLHADR